MNKLKIVILCGIDGTGKTTLKKSIEKKSNWKYIVLDRFSDSLVYDRIYHRQNRDKLFFKLEEDFNKIADIYLAYLECEDKILLERLVDKKEDKDVIDKINKAKEFFEDYLDKTPLKFTRVDTAKYNIIQCTNRIIKFVERGGK